MSTSQPAIPEAVAKVYNPLRQELVNIHVKWRLFLQLFGMGPSHIALLNRFAGGLFGVVQEVMYDDLVLSFFRLGDPPQTGKHDNLSLERLAVVVKANDTSLGGTIAHHLVVIQQFLGCHKNWRHKRIAHNDLTTAQARYFGTFGLQGPSRAQIEDILITARKLMNEVATHYGEGKTLYEEVILDTGDGDALIRHFTRLASMAAS